MAVLKTIQGLLWNGYVGRAATTHENGGDDGGDDEYMTELEAGITD